MQTLDLKFDAGGVTVKEGIIEGYASLFGLTDQGGDKVMPGAYTKSLARAAGEKRSIKMLWQHDPSAPIGVWDEVVEDAKGLHVKGRLISEVAKAKEAMALIEAGAMDGMSIGYRTRKSTKGADGSRELRDLDLWEVSLVTFPMLMEARVESVKSLPDEVQRKRMIEKYLREEPFGFTQDEAKHGAAMLVNEVLGRDVASQSAAMVDELRQFVRSL